MQILSKSVPLEVTIQKIEGETRKKYRENKMEYVILESKCDSSFRKESR